MFNVDLDKTEFPRALVIIVNVFVAGIAPLWYLFQYANSIFQNTETLKLVLLCFGFGIPVVLLNFVFMAFMFMEDLNNDPETNDPFAVTAFSSFVTFLIFYSPAVASFFKHITIGTALGISVLVQILILLFEILISTERRKQKKKLADEGLQ